MSYTTVAPSDLEPTTRVAIKARRVKFDWNDTPLHWIPGDPQTTHTINVLHLLLPAGERWFVDVYRQALPLVSDDKLRDDVKGFMGQEAVHSRAHAAVLDHLAEQGIDSTRYTRRVEWLFGRALGDKPLGIRVPKMLQRQWLIARLAIIAAIEHFTAVLGAWIINSPGLDAAGADATMLDLLRWHGAEEVEHRAVAFEMYQHVHGGYVRRLLAMTGVVLMMAWLWFVGVRFFMRSDPTKPARGRVREFVRAGRRGTLPPTGVLVAAVPRYFKATYHPLEEGSTADAVAYLSTSPAALGSTATAS